MRIYLPQNEKKHMPAFLLRDETVTFQRTGDLLEQLRMHTGSEPCILVINESLEYDALCHIRFCFPEVMAVPMQDLLFTFVSMQIVIARISPRFTVRTDHLMYIESRKRKLYFFFPDYYRTVNHPAKNLPDMTEYGIVRCHTSYFVNMSFVDRVEEQDIILKSGESLPVSRKYKRNLKKYRKKQSR